MGTDVFSLESECQVYLFCQDYKPQPLQVMPSTTARMPNTKSAYDIEQFLKIQFTEHFFFFCPFVVKVVELM